MRSARLLAATSPLRGSCAQSLRSLRGYPPIRTSCSSSAHSLKGKRTPTVERGDLDFNVLGIWFRVFFDVGIREQDHRGMVKSNGAAA